MSKVDAQPPLGMANRSDLSKRISAALDGTQHRGHTGLLAAACTVIVAAVFILSEVLPDEATPEAAWPKLLDQSRAFLEDFEMLFCTQSPAFPTGRTRCTPSPPRVVDKLPEAAVVHLGEVVIDTVASEAI
jgi:hypothetical protein